MARVLNRSEQVQCVTIGGRLNGAKGVQKTTMTKVTRVKRTIKVGGGRMQAGANEAKMLAREESLQSDGVCRREKRSRWAWEDGGEVLCSLTT